MVAQTHTRFRYVGLFALLLILYACSDSPVNMVEETDVEELITLPVNIHFMESSQSANLTSGLSEEDLTRLMEGVNEVWRPANIQWEVQRVETARAQNAAEFDRMVNGEIPFSATLIHSVIPLEGLSPTAWDVYLIRNLGGFVGGIYFARHAAVLQPETDPTGAFGFDGGLIRILSHELGHSLSLQHVPCVQPGNLMAPGCQVGNRTLMNDGQILQARSVARANRPYNGN
ncbi:MAG: hypothetical protein ACNA78_06215 [Balneolaceae bacterium]